MDYGLRITDYELRATKSECYLRLKFGSSADGLFFVEVETRRSVSDGWMDDIWTVMYDDEDAFLRLLIAADLGVADTERVVCAVLQGVNSPSSPSLDGMKLTEEQLRILRLDERPKFIASINDDELKSLTPETLFDPFRATRLYDLLMQAPTPLAILSGREHQFTFVNDSFVRLIRRSAAEEVLGKTLREAQPELIGQRFFGLLNTVFETGVPYVGNEVRANMLNIDGETREEAYFDFVYQPIFSTSGVVTGIMVQASEVTAYVLARQTSEHREGLLYRQWAEMDVVYRTAPIGLALVSADDFRILRLNHRQAELMGGMAHLLLGKRLLELGFEVPELRELLERVRAGETIENHILEGEVPHTPGRQRRWLVNYAPVRAEDGTVEAITLASIEVTQLAEMGHEWVPHESMYLSRR